MLQDPFDFVEFGRGDRPVVLLHGLFGSPENWRDIADEMNGDYRLLAPRFPIERRLSAPPPAIRHIAELTEFVKLFFDKLGLKSAFLCGNSLGGQVAIDFCLRYPERADGLAITGSAGLYERSLAGGKYPTPTPEFVRERVAEVFYDDRFVTDELVEEIVQMLADRKYRKFLIQLAKASRNCNLESELSDLKLPTLLVWGRDDEITPPFVGEQFCGAIANAQLKFIERCGHSPPIEQPEQFGRLLSSFLGSIVPSVPSKN